jgi:hypothetical protein
MSDDEKQVMTLFICGRRRPSYPTVRVVQGYEEKWPALGWELKGKEGSVPAPPPVLPAPVQLRAPLVLEWRKGGEPVKPPGGTR